MTRWALSVLKSTGQPWFPFVGWNQLNHSVGGRLVSVVPSAKFCQSLPCTEDQWMSVTFRSTIPGAMQAYNWEQDYMSQPPSLCLQNGTTCGQGNVPLYAINASTASDIQAGIKFAAKYNIKVAVKSSGHDFLGRSTAENSLLLWTRNLRNIAFADHFMIGGKDVGSTMTVGSGSNMLAMYAAAKAHGKMIVGGSEATVAAAGYAQGGGHSAFSPTLGLAADNAIEYQIVIADGSLVTANTVQNPDLFWALRGGGAGSWGVLISGTFRTFPLFNATLHTVGIAATTSASAGALIALHARHIFDWDNTRTGQYFFLFAGAGLTLSTWFVNGTAEAAIAAMKPLLDDARAANYSVQGETTVTAPATDVLVQNDTQLGLNALMGSRLIPETAYKSNAADIGEAYASILDAGIPLIFSHLVAGGQVAENAKLDTAVNSKWRTAKTHVIALTEYDDTLSPSEVEKVKQTITHQVVPILAGITGEKDSGSYSNEADVREPDFQTTFYGGGANYQRLLQIKRKYDPHDLFIVGAGVGSERWDSYGLCRL